MSNKKYAWCILHTADITAEKIKAESVGKITDADMENMLKSYQAVDGAKVLVSLEPLFHEDSGYPLVGWNEDADEKLKSFFYFLEQDSFMGCYQNDFERFSKEWDSKEYEPDGCISFKPENIEIIETVEPKEGENK
jgi:hypothetical protein